MFLIVLLIVLLNYIDYKETIAYLKSVITMIEEYKENGLIGDVEDDR